MEGWGRNIIRHWNSYETQSSQMRARLTAELSRYTNLPARNSVRSASKTPSIRFQFQSTPAPLYHRCTPPSASRRHLHTKSHISTLSIRLHPTPLGMNSLFSLRCLRSAAPQITASPATNQPSTILRALQQSRSFSSTPVPQKRNRGGPKKDARIRESTPLLSRQTTVLTVCEKK